MLVIKIGEAVSSPGGALQGHIADGQLLRYSQRLPQQVAVLILSAVAVVVAQELQGVSILEPGHILGDGVRLTLQIHGLHAGHKSMGMIVVKHQDQFRAAAIVEHRDPAGNGVVGPIVHGDSVVVGHRLPLNGQPAAAAVAQQGAVVIKSVSREPGHRTKIAIASMDGRIDAVGACVGNKGARVNAVVQELGGEKVDIILWSENPLEFIAKALSPATVISVTQTDEKAAIAVVPDDKLSLAIGRDGQNARLAARLTGWKIDVKSASAAEKMEQLSEAIAENTEDGAQGDDAAE